MIFWKCKKKKERFLWWVILGVGLDDWMQFIQYKNHCTFPLNMKTQHVCVHVFVCVRFPGCQGGADMGHIICGVISRARHSSSSVFLKQTGYTSKKGNTLACQPCVCVSLCVQLNLFSPDTYLPSLEGLPCCNWRLLCWWLF